jgi:hypothetical protein
MILNITKEYPVVGNGGKQNQRKCYDHERQTNVSDFFSRTSRILYGRWKDVKHCADVPIFSQKSSLRLQYQAALAFSRCFEKNEFITGFRRVARV